MRRFKVDYKGRELTKERNGMKFEECNIALCATLAIFITLYSRGYNYSPMGKSNARKIEIKGKWKFAIESDNFRINCPRKARSFRWARNSNHPGRNPKLFSNEFTFHVQLSNETIAKCSFLVYTVSLFFFPFFFYDSFSCTQLISLNDTTPNNTEQERLNSVTFRQIYKSRIPSILRTFFVYFRFCIIRQTLPSSPRSFSFLATFQIPKLGLVAIIDRSLGRSGTSLNTRGDRCLISSSLPLPRRKNICA